MSQNNNQAWKIEVEDADKMKMEYPSKNTYIDVETLCKKINTLMKSIFQDFNGSYLQVTQNPNGNGYSIIPILYFAEPSVTANKDLPRAFEPIVQEHFENLGMRANSFARNVNRNRVYQMTDVGREMFTANFIWNDGNVKYDYMANTVEEAIGQQYGATTATAVRVKSFGVDIRLIIEMVIKGIKPNDIVFFTPVATVGSSNPGSANFTNTLLKMEVIDADEFANIGRKYHIGEIQNVSTNAGPIVTA